MSNRESSCAARWTRLSILVLIALIVILLGEHILARSGMHPSLRPKAVSGSNVWAGVPVHHRKLYLDDLLGADWRPGATHDVGRTKLAGLDRDGVVDLLGSPDFPAQDSEFLAYRLGRLEGESLLDKAVEAVAPGLFYSAYYLMVHFDDATGVVSRVDVGT